MNDTVAWYIGMSLNRIAHPVATPAACLKLGFRVSVSRPSCTQRLVEDQMQDLDSWCPLPTYAQLTLRI